jgi:hypothetical protein
LTSPCPNAVKTTAPMIPASRIVRSLNGGLVEVRLLSLTLPQWGQRILVRSTSAPHEHFQNNRRPQRGQRTDAEGTMKIRSPQRH